MKFFLALIDIPNTVVVKEFASRNEMLSFVLMLRKSGRERDILCMWTEGGAQ